MNVVPSCAAEGIIHPFGKMDISSTWERSAAGRFKIERYGLMYSAFAQALRNAAVAEARARAFGTRDLMFSTQRSSITVPALLVS